MATKRKKPARTQPEPIPTDGPASPSERGPFPGDAGWEAELARRIVAGEARTSWEAVSAETTDDDLRRARDLVLYVVAACESGDRAALARFGPMLDDLNGLGSLRTERQAALVARVERWADALRTRALEKRHANLLRELLAFVDPAFEALDPARVFEVLSSCAGPRGGRGKRGPVTAAAILAIEARALGLGARPDEHPNLALKRAEQSLKTARRKTKN